MTEDLAEMVMRLHVAAERIDSEAPSPEMDTLAAAGARFLAETDLSTEDGESVVLDVSQAIGYGVMLGWLARDGADR